MAKRIVFVLDDGHFGFTKCSKCNADVENEYFRCPKCASRFDNEDKIEQQKGGSDF